MNYEEAVEKLELIKQAGDKRDKEWNGLLNDFLTRSVEYANTRARWALMTPEEIGKANKTRAEEHDVVIASLYSLARYAKGKGYDTSWATILERDRKDIGDFASFTHTIIGIGKR